MQPFNHSMQNNSFYRSLASAPRHGDACLCISLSRFKCVCVCVLVCVSQVEVPDGKSICPDRPRRKVPMSRPSQTESAYVQTFVRSLVFPDRVILNAQHPPCAFISVWTYRLSVWNLNLGVYVIMLGSLRGIWLFVFQSPPLWCYFKFELSLFLMRNFAENKLMFFPVISAFNNFGQKITTCYGG